jgi:hypothetical protein
MCRTASREKHAGGDPREFFVELLPRGALYRTRNLSALTDMRRGPSVQSSAARTLLPG